MSDLEEMYQEVVLEHSQSPRNCRILDDPSSRAEGFNPVCGDRVSVFVKVVDGRVVDVSFQGEGCAISTASASMMTEAIGGKTVSEAQVIAAQFCAKMTGSNEEVAEALVQLEPLLGVKRFPVRVKCATLVWRALEDALRRS
jgi:nitrogen fixation NifU-like protein